jgi:predicted flap endonuclease-1-like 5' DNA nuclease
MSSKKIDFLLPADVAAGATSGILLGDFNNWDSNNGVTLKQQKDGSLKASVSLESGSYEYRYLLNDGRWVNDTQAAKYTYISQFAIENCVIDVAIEATKEVKTKTVEAVATPVATPAKTVKAKATVPVASPVVEVAKADDLTKIEGIGKKIAELIVAEGIVTFDALSKTSVKTLQAILDKAGKRFNVHNPSTWAKQAKLAASGDWAKLQKLQAELNGGK